MVATGVLQPRKQTFLASPHQQLAPKAFDISPMRSLQTKRKTSSLSWRACRSSPLISTAILPTATWLGSAIVMTIPAEPSGPPNQFQRSCSRFVARSARSPAWRRRRSSRCSSTNIGQARGSAGTGTSRTSRRWSASRFSPPAPFGSGRKSATDGSGSRCRSSPARPICWLDPRGTSGSTVSRRWNTNDTRSPCGRWRTLDDNRVNPARAGRLLRPPGSVDRRG